MDYNDIDAGKILKTIRKRAGLSQEELAQKLFVEQSTISRIENGRSTLTANFLFECAKVTNTEKLVAELLFGEEAVSIFLQKVEALQKTDN